MDLEFSDDMDLFTYLSEMLVLEESLLLSRSAPPTDATSSDVEGKLYLFLRNIPCQKRWYQKLKCKVCFDGFEQTVSLQKTTDGLYSFSEVVILDIYEYYGPSKLRITLQASHKRVYSFTMTLQEVCSRQKRNASTVEPYHANSDDINVSTFPSPLFWQLKEKAEFRPELNNADDLKKNQKPALPFELCLSYVTISSFLDKDKNNFCPILQNGSESIICDALQTLSRNNLLRHALSIRTLDNKIIVAQSSSNSTDDMGCLPLEHAILSGNRGAVDALLRRAGNLCFQTSRKSGRSGMLFSAGESKESSVEARCQNELQACCLINIDAILQQLHSDEWYHIGSPLHVAVVANDAHVLRLLLQFLKKHQSYIVGWPGVSDKPVDSHDGRADGFTPLMLACALGHVACVQVLINSGATLDIAPGPNYLTPLMLACSSGSVETVNMLLSCKSSEESDLFGCSLRCSPNICNADGKNALGIAAEAGFADIVSKMIQSGISYRSIDNMGCTALHLAAANGHDGVCQVIAKAELEYSLQYHTRNFSRKKQTAVPKKITHEESKSNSSKSENNEVLDGAVAVTKRVLSDMTPRRSIFYVKDRRGRTAIDVAHGCGFAETGQTLENYKLKEQCSSEEFNINYADAANHERDSSESVTYDNEEEDSEQEAFNEAYKFSKILYFDESYENVVESEVN